MFLSIKKYTQIIQTLKTLLERPYLLDIVDKNDGFITFQYVKDNQMYEFTALKNQSTKRILN